MMIKKILTGKNRRVKDRIRHDGKVLCYDCKNYLDNNLFSIVISRGKQYYSSNCGDCRRKNYLIEHKLTQYPYGHWNIVEDDETIEQVILALKILGYDTEKDIHQQFMERHKEYFTDKK